MNAGQQAAVDMVDFILSDLIKLAQHMVKAQPSPHLTPEQQQAVAATLLSFSEVMLRRRAMFLARAKTELHEGTMQ